MRVKLFLIPVLRILQNRRILHLVGDEPPVKSTKTMMSECISIAQLVDRFLDRLHALLWLRRTTMTMKSARRFYTACKLHRREEVVVPYLLIKSGFEALPHLYRTSVASTLSNATKCSIRWSDGPGISHHVPTLDLPIDTRFWYKESKN
jgi:hypothetical protein